MKNTIILDDCFNVLPLIESNSINLIITDPPYSISKESNFKKSSDISRFNNITLDFGKWDTSIDLNILFQEYMRVLKFGGTVIFFYDIWKCNEVKDAAISSKFKQPRVGQWIKTNPTPVNSKNNYLSNSTEYFFTFVKGKKPTFNSYYDNGTYSYPICHGKERLKHPTQKPLKLIDDLIIKHSNQNDIILDTFSGSGTTAVSCIKNNRDFICIENNVDYHKISMERINNYF